MLRFCAGTCSASTDRARVSELRIFKHAMLPISYFLPQLYIIVIETLLLCLPFQALKLALVTLPPPIQESSSSSFVFRNCIINFVFFLPICPKNNYKFAKSHNLAALIIKLPLEGEFHLLQQLKFLGSKSEFLKFLNLIP